MKECCEEETLIDNNNNHLQSQRSKAISKWKNEKPHQITGYVPTLLEHVANIATHGICIIPAFNGFLELVKRSSNEQKFIAALVYGGSLFLVVTVSTLFHCAHYYFCQGRCMLIKNILHRCDRAFIYIFILGTYFPWLYAEVLEPSELFEKIRAGLCVMVILGILYQQLYHQKYRALETVFYVITGLMPSIALYGRLQQRSRTENRRADVHRGPRVLQIRRLDPLRACNLACFQRDRSHDTLLRGSRAPVSQAERILFANLTHSDPVTREFC